MNTGPLTFGTLLKRHRRACGLTQEELAERAELSVEAISALERGVSRTPHRDTVALLAEALGLSASDRAVFEAAARQRDTSAPAQGQAAPGAIPSDPLLVGRERELALLDRHLSSQGPPVLVLTGEPGIGKSRLLREAVARASAQGWSSLVGRARRAGQQPYACIIEALQRHIQGRQPSQLREELRQCAWLARLLPELGESGLLSSPGAALSAEQERRLMFGAVARFLANVAGPAGSLLVLDDLQWAAADELDLLCTLIQIPSGTPLRVVAAYRDSETAPQSPLAAALADLAQIQMAAHLKIGPLDTAEATVLLSHLLGEAGQADKEVVERVLGRAGGVPFFLVSCAQGLRDGVVTGGAPDDVPWNVAETIRQRIAALPERTSDLLAAAAVLAQPASRTLLAAIAQYPEADEDEAAGALDAACRARLLAVGSNDLYQFAHNIVRDVVWADLGTATRATLHRRAAEALERPPDSTHVEALAYHYSRCGEQEKAAEYLERAGDRARGMHANGAAEGYYRELIELLDKLGHVAAAARVRVKLGAVLRVAARFDEALEMLDQAAKAFQRTGDREGRRQAVAELGRAHARRGTPQEGIARVQALLAAAGEDEQSAGLAALHVALADLFYASGRYREQLAAAERGVLMARIASDEQLRTQAEQWRSTALLTLGYSDEALPVLEELIPQAEELGDLSSHLHALNRATLAYIERGEFAKSRAYIERGLAAAEVRGDIVQGALIRYYRGMLGIFAGHWEQARADFEHAVTTMRPIASAWTSAYPLLGLGYLCLLQGQWESAAAHLQEAIAVAERSGDVQALRSALVALAEHDLLEGHPDAARGRLARLLDRTDADAGEGSSQCVALLAWAYLDLGDLDQAAEVVARSIGRATQEQHRLSLVDALRVQSMLATHQQAWQQAEASLDEALELCRAMPCPYYEARVLYQYGLLETARGSSDAAREHLMSAAAILRRLGERLYAGHVARALAAQVT